MIDAGDALEDMAEGAMAEIVKQSRGETDGFLLIADIKIPPKLIDDLAGRLHHAQAVAVTGMVGPGIRQRCHPKLPDSAQALHLDRIEQSKQQPIDRALHAEGDDIVNRVADDLFGHAGRYTNGR